MKKICMALLAGAMILGLTACGGSGKTLVVGTEAGFAPYEYMSGNDVVGVDMDICAAIAEEMGMELEIKNMDFDGALAAVSSGKVDMVAAGVSVTDERKEVMDFSHEYVDSTEVVVQSAEHPAFANNEDITAETLNDMIVGVQQGNIADSWVSSGENCTPAEVKRYTKFAQAAEDLKNGKIDYIVMDVYPAQELVAGSEGLEICNGVLFEDKYAIAVEKGNQELLDQINAVIDKLIADGKIDEFYANHTTAASN